MDTPDPQPGLAAVPPEQEGSTEVIGSQGRKTRHKTADIRPYDFRQPLFLAPADLRRLRRPQEDFARSLTARLSMYLRMEVSFEVSKLHTTYYHNFTEGLGSPAHVTLFKAEPLKGICLLDIPPRLGLTIVDRLLGGLARGPANGRELTEIESALLNQAVQIILNEWCSHWQSFEHLQLAVLGDESSGKYLQTAPHDTVMVCLSLEARVGDCVEQMQLAFPHYTLEPIVRHLAAMNVTEKEITAPAAQPTRWNSELDDVPVAVTAEWSGLELTGHELVALKPGDVLMLDPQAVQQVQIHVGSAAKYKARLGTRGNRWAVELTQPLTN